MDEIFKHRQDIEKNILKSFQSDIEKSEESDIEKSRSGIYADTAENRKLNRVGQQYGSKKQEDEPNGEQSSKQEENSGSKNSKSVEEHAKNTSDETLRKVSENEKAPEDLRNAAKKELESRGTKNTKEKEDKYKDTQYLSTGSGFFDAFYKISESDLDWEDYLYPVLDYVEKNNLGLDDKYQEQDFDKLSLKHKTVLANKIKKAVQRFVKDGGNINTEE